MSIHSWIFHVNFLNETMLLFVLRIDILYLPFDGNPVYEMNTNQEFYFKKRKSH